jgi:hypothetical protein
MGQMQRQRRIERELDGKARARVTLRPSNRDPRTMDEALRRLDVEVRLWSRSTKKARKAILRLGCRVERLTGEFPAAALLHLESLYEA